MFPTQYEHPKSEYSVPGNRYQITYHMEIDENGVEDLKPDGQTDLYQEIQSHESSVDLELILERYRNGDVNALERAQAMYADISDVPIDMRDLLNLNIRAREYFETLDPEYKQIYGNDYTKYIMQPGKILDYINSKNANLAKSTDSEKLVENDKQEQ